MLIQNGERIVKIKSTRKARLHGDWYLDLVGQEFSVIMYNICAAEYTVSYKGSLRILAEEDVEIISDTKEDPVSKQKVYVVVTTISDGERENFADVVLISTTEQKAQECVGALINRDAPALTRLGINTDNLAEYESASYFTREIDGTF
jgi:hypothetical protein